MKTKNNHFSNWKKEDFIFNGEILTDESINKTIQYFANNAQGCIDEVESGKVRVNDKEKYFKDCLERKERYLNKDFNVSLTFLQHAYYEQTNKCIALLP